jgi:hypothetical protein
MSNYVTYQTALRLRSAGFPQPEVARGVVYISERGLYKFDRGIRNSVCHYLYAIDHHGWVSCPVEHFGETFCFAPGPAEILRELPGYVCGNNKGSQPLFWCGKVEDSRASFHESLAEACAAEWLIHNQKNSK